MRRRGYVLAALVLLLAGGAAAGSLLATGGGSDSTISPTGARTVLRVQPLQETVTCGTAPAVVHIYLDDLEARPSPKDPSASLGLAAATIPLRYDPRIVRIARPIDIEINPALSTLDADGDGRARSFFPVTNVDDYAGRAVLGTASLASDINLLSDEAPPPGRDPALNLEEGVDPVAQGEPLLLLTVRFLTVGQGTTTLSVGWPEAEGPPLGKLELVDPIALQPYEPVEVKDATLMVKGGDCPPAPPATPRPTLVPTISYPPPMPTPLTMPTPAPVGATLAAEGGRPDCPEGWNVHNDTDGHFSLCYPREWNGVTAPSVPGGGTGLFLHTPVGVPPSKPLPNDMSLTVYWESYSSFAAGVIDTRCELDAFSWGTEAREVTVQLASRLVVACQGVGDTDNHGFEPLSMEIPDEVHGGWIQVFAFKRGPDIAFTTSVMRQVLSTIRVH